MTRFATIGQIRVAQRPGTRSLGRLTAGALTLTCALGKGGLTSFKREGDGCTPCGLFALRRIWYRADHGRRPPSRLPLRITRPDDGWCDAAAHPRYNRPVPLPFHASHERMWRDDHLYDIVIEIGWNDAPAIAGRGSAIFMHLARPGYTPTEGCVALSPGDMRRLLPLLRRETRIRIG
jgi:L,D-peptidoglycan transpeptidase YkuD (ErfK/YbiS/YcfS/YnhG family)